MNEPEEIDPLCQSVMQSLLSGKMAEAFALIPPEWRFIDEDALVELAFNGWENVSDTLIDLRKSFWVVYSIALHEKKPIFPPSIYRGVCSKDYYFEICKIPRNVAFITTENKDDRRRAQKLLRIGWTRMRNILESRDPKLADLQAKVFQYLDQRQNGKLIERHQHLIKQETTVIDGGKAPAHNLPPQELDKELEHYRKLAALPPAQRTPEILDAVTHNEKILETTARNVEDDKRGG